MLAQIEDKIISTLKNDISELKTVKAYEGDLTSEKLSKLPVLAPFVFVIYMGRNPQVEINERNILFKYRLLIGEVSYKKDNARLKVMDLLEKIEQSMIGLIIPEFNMEPFRLREEGLFYTDDKFSIYFQDYEAYMF